MNGKKNSPANGQESSGTANELQIDDGVSRRQFLGAATALSASPAFGGTAVAASDDPAEFDADQAHSLAAEEPDRRPEVDNGDA